MQFKTVVLFLLSCSSTLAAPFPNTTTTITATEKRQLGKALQDVTDAIPGVGGGDSIGSLRKALGDLVNAIPGIKEKRADATDYGFSDLDRRELDKALAEFRRAIAASTDAKKDGLAV
ncbi:hypothetical protein MPH_05346 [Macrophomina phaseolina MS6]|uniref:Uncharacterized protein n=1 Tax=Macrophomina phaseolina (strain MS6) TaxID=1126212 RepID=K2SKV2_MACPH|nr:hypothetical protein MPH_05346 [Macrophomina phaseolina MS6]